MLRIFPVQVNSTQDAQSLNWSNQDLKLESREQMCRTIEGRIFTKTTRAPDAQFFLKLLKTCAHTSGRCIVSKRRDLQHVH